MQLPISYQIIQIPARGEGTISFRDIPQYYSCQVLILQCATLAGIEKANSPYPLNCIQPLFDKNMFIFCFILNIPLEDLFWSQFNLRLGSKTERIEKEQVGWFHKRKGYQVCTRSAVESTYPADRNNKHRTLKQSMFDFVNVCNAVKIYGSR